MVFGRRQHKPSFTMWKMKSVSSHPAVRCQQKYRVLIVITFLPRLTDGCSTCTSLAQPTLFSCYQYSEHGSRYICAPRGKVQFIVFPSLSDTTFHGHAGLLRTAESSNPRSPCQEPRLFGVSALLYNQLVSKAANAWLTAKMEYPTESCFQ